MERGTHRETERNRYRYRETGREIDTERSDRQTQKETEKQRRKHKNKDRREREREREREHLNLFKNGQFNSKDKVIITTICLLFLCPSPSDFPLGKVLPHHFKNFYPCLN